MAFNKDIPSADTSLRQSNPEILANQSALQAAIDNEHEFTGTSAATQDGYHTQGSARPFFQASAPTTRINGTGFETADLGILWIDSDDNAIYELTALTPTWTPVSDEVISTLLSAGRVFLDTLGVTGDFAINTDKLTIAAASGSLVTQGNVSVVGFINPTSFSVAAGGFKDEDDMSSDSATVVASQQSIKSYVDNSTARDFGEYTLEDDETNAMLKAHAYLANQDGFVTAYIISPSGTGTLVGYIGTTTNPAGAGDGIAFAEGTTGQDTYITFPVASGKYFEITTNQASVTIRWHPVGTLIKPTDNN